MYTVVLHFLVKQLKIGWFILSVDANILNMTPVESGLDCEEAIFIYTKKN